jgi:5'-nucleotidase
MNRKLNILLTNDDGIHAPGLAALEQAFAPYAETLTVAPMHEQSGTGHSITLNRPIRVREVREGGRHGYAVEGTPSDCVKFGVTKLSKKRPDAVISGVNPGGNIGINVLYSGTVSAALEAYSLGIPAIAVSINGFKNLHFDFAAEAAVKVALGCIKSGRPVLVNMNIPDIPPEKIKGIKATTMGRSRFEETFRERADPRGHTYYWLDGEMTDRHPDAQSDYWALDNDYISLTPLQLNLTDKNNLKFCRKLAASLD